MIRFDRVTKLYPGNSKPALNGVDVEIKAGEFVFLVGASGSGKSSFLRLVLKEERPSSGEIHVLGQRLSSISNRKIPYFRRSLGVVFQDFRLLPGRTVYQNVAFTLQVIGKSRGFIQEAVPDVLQMVGLEGKSERLPHELSGGEQQRVAIARAVVNKPAILLADEPTGNLDPATSAGIMQVLELINAGGTTVVMATHDVGIVDSMKRRVIELTGGDIIRDEFEGGYTTSIPVQAAPVPLASSLVGAAAFAAAAADEVGPLQLPSTPRTVVETSPQVTAEAAPPATAPIRVAPSADAAEPRVVPAAAPAAQSAPLPSPAMGTPVAYPGAVPTMTGTIPRIDDFQVRPAAGGSTPASGGAPVAAGSAPAAPAPLRRPSREPSGGDDPLRHLIPQSPQRPAEHDAPAPGSQGQPAPQPADDDPLALAVKLGLRRPGAHPENTSSQEVGPTS